MWTMVDLTLSISTLAIPLLPYMAAIIILPHGYWTTVAPIIGAVYTHCWLPCSVRLHVGPRLGQFLPNWYRLQNAPLRDTTKGWLKIQMD